MRKNHKLHQRNQTQCSTWTENEHPHKKEKVSSLPYNKDEAQTSKLLPGYPSKVNQTPILYCRSCKLHSDSSLRSVSEGAISPMRCCGYSHGIGCQMENYHNSHKTSSRSFQTARILKNPSPQSLGDKVKQEHCAKILVESVQQDNAISLKMPYYQSKQNKTSYNTSKIQKHMKNGSIPKKTLRNKKKYQTLLLHVNRKNPALLNKDLTYKPRIDLRGRDIPDNFYTALFTMLCCCPPFGIASLMQTFKVRKFLAAGDFKMARKSSAKGRKLNIRGILVGCFFMGLAIFAYVIVINFQNNWWEVEYPIPRYPVY